MTENTDSKPNINVTPLIDILLVLLIIFMAISPLKPSSFKAKIPSEPKPNSDITDINSLIVTVNPDSSLMLNQEKELGTIGDPQKLVSRLSNVFQKRRENGVYAENTELNQNLTEEERIQKTVFIKAPRNLPYTEVAKVVDSVKLAGANPIGLQIDRLE
jgi:biopolymer transport protein ExbD